MADYPRIRDLPTVEQRPFLTWLTGQTRPYIEVAPAADQDAYYPWDYLRWKDGQEPDD